MKAAWYERPGPAREVLVLGELVRIIEAHELVEAGAAGRVVLEL